EPHLPEAPRHPPSQDLRSCERKARPRFHAARQLAESLNNRPHPLQSLLGTSHATWEQSHAAPEYIHPAIFPKSKPESERKHPPCSAKPRPEFQTNYPGSEERKNVRKPRR